MTGVVFLILGFWITDLVQGKNIEVITIFTITIACCLALQDIAVDAFVLKILSPDYFSLGSSIEVVARIIGVGLACPLFLYLQTNVYMGSV